VLDTWFSSWLWPFATMGWTGDKSQDSKKPNTSDLLPDERSRHCAGDYFLLGRAHDHGRLRVHRRDAVPQRLFHRIIRDKIGRKMSKTLGNSPDPLDLIAKYGADAVRFGTMRSAPLGQDVMFDEKDVELGRNFCNKLWNAVASAKCRGAQAARLLRRATRRRF